MTPSIPKLLERDSVRSTSRSAPGPTGDRILHPTKLLRLVFDTAALRGRGDECSNNLQMPRE